MAGSGGEAVQVIKRQVGQGIGFEVTSDIFGGIQLRGIGWKKHGVETGVLSQPSLHPSTPVGQQAIPQQDPLVRQLVQELSQEFSDPLGCDVRAGMEAEIQMHAVPLRVDHQSGDDGNLLPGAASLVQQRPVPAGRPAPPDQRCHQQAALIEEGQPGVQPRGFFLIRGPCRFTQRWIASSSRSMARRSGFWGLQPREWSKEPT